MIGIESITKAFQNLFDSNMRKPAAPISAMILACSLSKRPGMSVVVSTSNIINELSKQGFPTEDLPDGTPNFMNRLVHAVVEEVYRAIKFDSSIQGGMSPGSLSVTTTGANAGGPVLSKGMNDNFVHFYAKME